MNITILMVGNTSEAWVKEGYENFMRRLQYYIKTTEIVIPDLRDRKNMSVQQIKSREAELLLTRIPSHSFVILLDEKGTDFSSVEFSGYLQKQMNSGLRELVFIIGGAYGVDESVRTKAGKVISLSKMTFTHQFIRLILAEQLYRAMTILRNEPYHNA